MKKLTKKELWTDIGIFLSLITLCSLVMTGITQYNLDPLDGEWLKYFSPLFSVLAKGISAIIAINEFGGDPVYTAEFLNDTYRPFMIAALSSIIFTLLVVPFLFLKALEALRAGKRNVVYYFGVTLMIFVLGTNLVALPTALIISYNTWDSAAQSRELDMARQHLSDAAYLAAEEMIMNYSEVYKESEGPLKIRELGKNLTAGLKKIENMDTEKYDLIINKQKSDSTLLLHLVMDQESGNAEVKNINGSTGKKELVIEIDPQRERIFSFIKSNPK